MNPLVARFTWGPAPTISRRSAPPHAVYRHNVSGKGPAGDDDRRWDGDPGGAGFVMVSGVAPFLASKTGRACHVLLFLVAHLGNLGMIDPLGPITEGFFSGMLS